jgi:hypothetical protein
VTPGDARWPAIRTLLRHRRLVPGGGALAVAAFVFLIAWRAAMPELYIVGAVLAAAMSFVLRVAIEVVDLVAETLMPQ